MRNKKKEEEKRNAKEANGSEGETRAMQPEHWGRGGVRFVPRAAAPHKHALEGSRFHKQGPHSLARPLSYFLFFVGIRGDQAQVHSLPKLKILEHPFCY